MSNNEPERRINVPGVSDAAPRVTEHHVLIVDASGSMERLAQEVSSGVREHVQRLVDLQSTQNNRVTLVYFSSVIKHRTTDAAPDSVLANMPQYSPGGMTALHKTVYDTLRDLEQMLGEERAKNEPVVVTIFSDGEDTVPASRVGIDLPTLIKRLQDDFGWDINLVGANFDVLTAVQGLNIRTEGALLFNPDRASTRAAFLANTNYVLERANARSLGQSMNTVRLASYQRDVDFASESTAPANAAT